MRSRALVVIASFGGGLLALAPASALVLARRSAGYEDFLFASVVTTFAAFIVLILIERKIRGRGLRTTAPLLLLAGLWSSGLLGDLNGGAQELARTGATDLMSLPLWSRCMAALGMATYVSIFGFMFLSLALPLASMMEWWSRKYDHSPSDASL